MRDPETARSITQLDQRVARSFYGNFTRLRPVQEQAIGPILAGRDVIALAGTGSGKTEAAVAPLVSRFLREMVFAERPQLLYIAPTRALVNDIHRRLEPALDRIDVSIGIRHGERNDLARKSKPASLVTTPESLDVMLWNSADVLTEVRAVVLDEAHLLYNTQRGMQLAILLRRLESAIDRPVQVVATSATVADADALWGFFRPSIDPVVVQDAASRGIVRQIRFDMSPDDLASRLDRLASTGPAKILVFTDSRRECDEVAAALRERSRFGERVFAHHSSLSKDLREHAEASFLSEATAVCVATSTLELGIDIGDIDLVVLWGRALGWQSFLQRIGRGNRRSDTVNVLCALPAERSSVLSAAIGFQGLFRQVQGGRVESDQPLHVFGAACQQVLSVIMARKGGFVPASELIDLLAGWPHLDRDAVHLMLDELVAREVLVKHPVKRWYGPGEAAYEIEDQMLLWSNLPLSSREIPVVSGGHEVGKVAGQNLLKLRAGSVFSLGTRRYSVTRLQADRIDVVTSSAPASAKLSFGGTKADLDPTLLEAEFDLLCRSAAASDDVVPPTRRARLSEALHPLEHHQADETLLYCRVGAKTQYLTFAGRLLNSVMAIWFCGGEPGEISLCTSSTADFSSLPSTIGGFGDAIRQVEYRADSQTIFQAMLPVELTVEERLDVWRRRPVFQRTITRLRNARPVEVPGLVGLEID